MMSSDGEITIELSTVAETAVGVTNMSVEFLRKNIVVSDAGKMVMLAEFGPSRTNV